MILANPIFSGSINVSGSINLNGQPLTISLVPVYGSTSPLSLNSTASIQTLTVTGENFDGSAIGYVKGDDGTRYDPTTSIRNSDVQLTLNFSGSDRLISTNEPYDIYILNGNGENTFEENVVYVDASPVWQTAAGKIGQVYIGTSLTASLSVIATDPDSNDTVSYFITGGALPTGMIFITASGEISQSGEITEQVSDTPSASGVNYNVTFAATDGTSNVARTFYITKKWPDGSTEELAVNSAEDLSLISAPSGNKYVNIDGIPYLVQYDSSDKFSNGVTGWLNISNTFVGSNNSLASFYSVGTDSDAGWSNAASGQFYIGNPTWTGGSGPPNLGRIRVKLPKLRYAAINTLTATGAGSNTPDDGASWVTDPVHTDNFVNSYIALDTPTINNDNGYPWALWNGNSSANKTNGGIIFPKPGGELGSIIGSVTKTFSAGDFNVVSFSDYVNLPYLWAGSGDGADEIYTFTAYELWVH